MLGLKLPALQKLQNH